MNILVHYRKWTRMDYLEEIITEPGPRPRRRIHGPEFKAHLVALCKDSAVSVAAIARAHDINDNMLHRWIKEAKFSNADPDQATVPALLSLRSLCRQLQPKVPERHPPFIWNSRANSST